MRKSPKFSPEVVERAVRMVFDAKDQYPSQWAAIDRSPARSAARPRHARGRQGERDSGLRPGQTTAEQQRIKELEREVREPRKTNEILKLASAYFAQAELDRQFRKGERLHRRAPRSLSRSAVRCRSAGCTAATLARLDRGRGELGLRVQGILMTPQVG